MIQGLKPRVLSGIVFLCLFSMVGTARAETPLWRTLNRLHGLAANDVRDILRDSRGNLWFATAGGLSRFDGLWETFARPSGLAANDVRTLLETPNRTIWVGTGAGVNALISNGNGGWRIESLADGMLPGESVSDLALALDGTVLTVWAGTRHGLYRWTGASWELYQPTADFSVRVVEPDADGRLWCVRDGGFGRPNVLMSVESSQLAPVEYPLPTESNLVTANALLPMSRGQWWVGTTEGIFFFDGTWSHPLAPPGQPEVTRFARTPDNAIWAATNNGLFHFDREWTQIGAPDGLPSLLVQTVHADRNGGVWAGTRSGVAFLDPTWLRYAVTDGLPSNAVAVLKTDLTGNLWIGTPDGLGRWNAGDRAIYSTESGLPSADVTSIAVSPEGGVWVGTAGTRGGLAAPTAQGTWRTLRAVDGIGQSNEVYSLLFDSKGHLWVGTGIVRGEDIDQLGGLAHFDGQEWESLRMEGDATPIALAEDARGNLWIGTLSRGLFRLIGDAFVAETAVRGGVRALVADSDGILWVGTSDGLFGFDGTQWQEHSLDGGFLGNSVHALYEDNAGRLWAGLNEGVAVRDRNGVWIHYGIEDGLPPAGVGSVTQTLTGDYWFAGLAESGLIRHIVPDTAPQTQLNQAPRGVIGESAADLTFSGGSAGTPTDQIRFSTRLNGGPWSPPDFQPFSRLRDLQQGAEIAFEVRAVDRDGNADPTPARTEFRVDVTPPVALLLSPNNNAVVTGLQGAVQISGTAADITDFDRYVLAVNGTPVAERDEPVANDVLGVWDAESLPDGEYVVSLTVWDRLDSESDRIHQVSVNVALQLDNTLPVAELTVPPDVLSGQIRLNMSAADEHLANYRLRYTQSLNPTEEDWLPIQNGNLLASGPFSVVWDSSEVDMAATLRLEVTDDAGNRTQVLRAVALSNDTARPTVRVTAPENGSYVGRIVTMTGTVTDTSLESYRVETRKEGEADWTTLREESRSVVNDLIATWDTGTFPDGAYQVRVTARDTNGYVGQVVLEIFVDNLPPSIEWMEPRSDGRYGNPPPDIVAEVRDASPSTLKAEYALEPDAASWTLIEQRDVRGTEMVRIRWTGGIPGETVFVRLSAEDRAKNTSAPTPRTLNFDTRQPSILLENPQEDAHVRGRVPIRGIVADANLASYEVWYEDSAGDRHSIPRGVPVAGILADWDTSGINGTVRLTVQAEDAVGLVAVESRQVTVDNRAPEVAIVTPKPSQQVSGVVQVVGTAVDDNFREYTAEWATEEEPSRWFPLSGPIRLEVREGTLATWNALGLTGRASVRITARDIVGHETIVETTVFVTPALERTQASLVVSANAKVWMRIPPNALAAPVAPTVNPLPIPEAGGLPVLAAYVFDPTAMEFDPRKPATLEFAYDEIPVTPPRDRNGHLLLGVMEWNAEAAAWEWLGGTVDERQARVRVPARRFGRYALVMGSPTVAPSSDALRVRVQPRAFSPQGSGLPTETVVHFHLRQSGNVVVKVFNGAGRLARRLVSEPLREGNHAFPWDGRDDAGRPLPNGLYILTVETPVGSERVFVIIWNQG